MSHTNTSLRIALIREGKTPPDKRVPLSPAQAKAVMERWPSVTVVAQSSNVRKFSDEAYRSAGVDVVERVDDCDILLGVKEVPIAQLVPDKTYLFFSHTFKMQPYNAKLLAALIAKRIRLIDYEVIRDTSGKRLIGFGRYAGVVGCYNGWRLFGLRHGLFTLKPANECHNREEMEGELKKVTLPASTKVVLTGFGRVGHGAREIMKLLPIAEVTPDAFLHESHAHPVFTHLDVEHYNERMRDGGFDKGEFYKDPSGYRSTFPRYAHKADMYIACHYFGDGAPFLYTREDAKHPDWKTKVVADVSCDIDGPVASTLRPSTIADPFYGYHPAGEAETDFMNPESIAVMAIDNLPCELPFDASIDFGDELMKHVLPLLIEGDPDGIIERATETSTKGGLTPQFSYLQAYADKGMQALREMGLIEG
jgi:hypothetical protein